MFFPGQLWDWLVVVVERGYGSKDWGLLYRCSVACLSAGWNRQCGTVFQEECLDASIMCRVPSWGRVFQGAGGGEARFDADVSWELNVLEERHVCLFLVYMTLSVKASDVTGFCAEGWRGRSL